MSDSPEFVKNTYIKFLKREPDVDELKRLVDQLNQNKISKSDVLYQVECSEEAYRIKAVENGVYVVDQNISFNIKTKEDMYPAIEIFEEKCYSNELFKIRDSDKILDLGAHIGSFTVWATNQAKNVSVFAFEASSRNFELLKENIKRNNLDENCRCFNLGVFDKNGTMILRKPKNQDASFGFSLVWNEDQGDYVNEVQCITIDDISKSIVKADVIKMDIEGSEFPIFLSLKEKSIESCRCIVLEYHVGETEQSMLKNKFKEFGFEIEVKKNPVNKDQGLIFGKR